MLTTMQHEGDVFLVDGPTLISSLDWVQVGRTYSADGPRAESAQPITVGRICGGANTTVGIAGKVGAVLVLSKLHTSTLPPPSPPPLLRPRIN